MSHRIPIINKMREMFADPEIQSEMTVAQCERVNQILQANEPSDDDFRYLTRRLNKTYCHDD